MKKYVIRKAIENKKHWVVDVYYNSRPYPNVISGRYLSKKNAQKAVGKDIQDDSKFNFWGDL